MYLCIFFRVKNTKAAERILDKEPTTAEQFDKVGRNFLHLAINEKDTESILFLIQVKVDVNSRTKVMRQKYINSHAVERDSLIHKLSFKIPTVLRLTQI